MYTSRVTLLRSSIVTLALLSQPVTAQLLSLVEVEADGALGTVRSLAIAPGGEVLVAVARGDNSVVSYTRDAVTGELTFADQEVDGADGVDGLRMAQALAISADGEFVYVASRGDDAISVFSLDSTTGALGFVQVAINEVGGIEGLWQNKGVAVSPDGAYVLGSGRSSPAAPQGAIALFTRDASTGMITFADLVLNGSVAGLSGLGNGGEIDFSPDGAHVYVVSDTGNAVVVFSIDTANDLLQFEGQVLDGVGASGLAGATSIAFSADGSQAYVTGAASSALSRFSRDTTTGLLTYIETFTDGIDGVDGLAGAANVRISPNGLRVYVSGSTDNAIAVFARAGDGSLIFIGVARDGEGGLEGLGGVWGLALSSDDAFLYAAASAEARKGVFARGPVGGGEDAFDFGDAPDPTFPTLLASDGARHAISSGVLRLGATVDAEPDGQPDAEATGDDLSLANDEDGITFVTALNPGQPGVIQVTATAPGLLDAWIDWNGDGDWDDAGERIANGAPVVAGITLLPVGVPAGAAPDSFVFARFRLSSAGVAGPTGAAADGEVEDYRTAIGRGADLAVTPSGEVLVDWLDPYMLTVTVSNLGPNDVTGAQVEIVASANSGPVTWTCVGTNANCAAAGAGDVDELVDVSPGGSAVFTFSGTVPDEAPGPWIEAAATVTPPAGTGDPVAANNTAAARVKILSIFLDGFETGDTTRWSTAVSGV